MLYSLKLLLPALIPSWNFFDVIAPSPRVQFRTLNKESETRTDWQLFRPRPASLSFTRMLKRMLWNAHWNESLFIMSCAERLIEYPTLHSEDEILKRIANDLFRQPALPGTTYIQFRLLTFMRENDEMKMEQVYESRLAALTEFVNENQQV